MAEIPDFNFSDIFGSTSDHDEIPYIVDIAKLVLLLTDPNMEDLDKLLYLKHFVTLNIISEREAAYLWCYRDMLENFRNNPNTDPQQ